MSLNAERAAFMEQYPAAGSAGEEVEAVAYRYRCTDFDGNPIPNWYYSDDAGSLGLREPLMTVAQHERIVAALSAQQGPSTPPACAGPAALEL